MFAMTTRASSCRSAAACLAPRTTSGRDFPRGSTVFARGQRRLLSSQPSSRPRDCVHAHTSTPPEEARDNLGPRTASPSDAARSSACADDVQVAPDISASSGSRYATELHSWFGLSRQPFTSFSATEVKPETPQASAHLLSTAAIDNTATAGSVDVDDSTTDAVLAVSSAAAAGAAMEEEQAPTTASTAVAAQEEGYHEHQLDAPATPAAPEVMRRGVSVATTCPGCGAAVLDEAAIEMATGDTAKGRRNKRKLQDPRNWPENALTLEFLEQHTDLTTRDYVCYHGWSASSISRKSKKEGINKKRKPSG